ncbi:cytochrome c oxidase copper chaperone [Callorhinchus milii]|uniref:cytochrome c oxidase copper chaperone n=1 Tax=Callorhinchus milii TaxID=7868 RepID=UPI001C3FC87E|nr:cytochrome c oxidase copper chaperone [Callorhinchus milii]
MSEIAAAATADKACGGGQAPGAGAGEKKPLKPCCACPDTKKVRDACIIEKGEENCRDLIEAHKDCMRALGFKI